MTSLTVFFLSVSIVLKICCSLSVQKSIDPFDDKKIEQKLREKTKLARVAREVAEPWQSSLNNITLVEGSCGARSCETETACVPYNATRHFCVCVYNGEVAKEGVTCPRSTVQVPQPIHNIVIPRPSPPTIAPLSGSGYLPLLPTAQDFTWRSSAKDVAHETLEAYIFLKIAVKTSQAEETCHDCAEAVEAEEVYKRAKRADGKVLKEVGALTHGILGIVMGSVVELNKQNAEAKKKTLIIGPGEGNKNLVMFNNKDDDFVDYNGRSYNSYRNQGNNYRNQRNGYGNQRNDYGNQRNDYGNQGNDYYN